MDARILKSAAALTLVVGAAGCGSPSSGENLQPVSEQPVLAAEQTSSDGSAEALVPDDEVRTTSATTGTEESKQDISFVGDPGIYSDLQTPTQEDLLEATESYEQRTVVFSPEDYAPGDFWLTTWVVNIDGLVPIYCVGSATGAGCSPDSAMSGETPPISILSVGGAPSEIIVRLRPDVEVVEISGIDGSSSLAHSRTELPTGTRIGGLHVPDPDAEVVLVARNTRGDELERVSIVVGDFDSRASGERTPAPGPASLPPFAPAELLEI